MTSRKKEVERLQNTRNSRSVGQVQRPFIRFQIERPSGQHPLEVPGLAKSYDDLEVIKKFSAKVSRGEKIALMGRNGCGKTTMLRSLLRNARAGLTMPSGHSRSMRVRSPGGTKSRWATSRRTIASPSSMG
ncbi:MAG: ATP-binding cassette domain-containing protein [Paludibaculum sp.]